MLEGGLLLFKVALAMCTLREAAIMGAGDEDDPGLVFNALSQTPAAVTDPDVLMKLAFSFMHVETGLSELRGALSWPRSLASRGSSEKFASCIPIICHPTPFSGAKRRLLEE